MISELIDGSINVSFRIILGAQSNVVQPTVILLAEPTAVLRFDALPLLFNKTEVLQTRN
jgi:hypothetical protein